MVQVLHPPQKFERPPSWNGWRYGIKEYGVEIIFNGMTFLPNFIKIYQLVQNLLGGTQTDRQTGDLISLTFLLKESRLIMILIVIIEWTSISIGISSLRVLLPVLLLITDLYVEFWNSWKILKIAQLLLGNIFVQYEITKQWLDEIYRPVFSF
jgi:hypothetical protein